MSREPDVLKLPAGKGMRVVALELLGDARRAGVRLDRGGDAEALHDFRVALRRLRSWLRSFKDSLAHSVPEKMRDGLGDVADATNAGRDVEVQLEILRDTAPRRRGAAWFVEQLRARQRATSRPYTEPLHQFESIASTLERRFASYRTRTAKARRETLATAVASRIPAHAVDLDAALKKIRSANDMEEAHEARIAGKRLRYLLEPIAPRHAKGRALLRSLKSLQDDLGDLHDLHVLQGELANTIDGAPARRRQSLQAVEELIEDATVKAFRRVRKRWLRKQAPDLGKQAERLIKRLPKP